MSQWQASCYEESHTEHILKRTLRPSRRRQCIDHVCDRLGISERRACRVLGQHRSTQRRIPRGRDDEDRLVADMIELAR